MHNRDSSLANCVISFGPFRLLPAERLLKKGDDTLPLGGRALDLLITLVERSGDVLSHKELLSRVWPDVTVEEANLRVHIAGLRKALGDGQEGARYVATVAGRGYCFVAPLTRSTMRQDLLPSEFADARPLPRLPAQLERMVGRDQIVSTLVAQLLMSRFVSIVGPGGMGKTTVAVAVAHAMLNGFGDAVFFVDLAPLTDPALVQTAVAATLGSIRQTHGSLGSLLTFISDKKILLVLDSCEHVVDAAAPLAERVVSEAPQAHVLATSREALRVEGEHVHLLHALDCPPNDASLTAAEALKYPAAQLFMMRAAASGYSATPSDADALLVSKICRSLDGIPLAIELAASRVGAHDISGTAELLQNRFGRLWQGRRTALPRHQTLNAMLDWSYNLLSEDEKLVLRRLSVFMGDFKLQAARSVTADAETDDAKVVIAVDSLVAKSLLSAASIDGSTWYRLADTTKSYALKKLEENREHDRLARRHAEFYCGLFEKAASDSRLRSFSENLADFTLEIDNLRAALNWAFSDVGVVRLGVRLASEAVDFWLSSSLLAECREWCARALAHLDVDAGTPVEMLLHCGLGIALIRTTGMTPEAEAALTRAAALSAELAALDYVNHQLLAVFGLWLFSLRAAKLRECLVLAGKYEVIAKTFGTPAARATADRMLGQSQFFLGEYAGAAASLQRARTWDPRTLRSDALDRFDADPRVVNLCYGAVTLWSLGFVDRAIRAREDALKEARDINHPVSLCVALASPSGVLLVKIGDLETAECCINELIEHSAKHSLIPYNAFGLCAMGSLMATRGDFVSADRSLRNGLQRMREIDYNLYYAFFLAEWAMVLAASGRLDEGVAEIDAAQRYAEESQSLWCLPEVLRIKGEIFLKRDPTDLHVVEGHFKRAQTLAYSQEGLSWELRAAISLARLLRAQRRFDEAISVLQPVYDRFIEGFGTVDLKAAKGLLDSL